MSQKITYDQKETCLEAVKSKGTIKAGAEASGVSAQTIHAEMRRSAIFKRKVHEALEQGRQVVGDRAVERIIDIASVSNKDMRSQLTANIAIANWAVPGFRGSSKVEGRIEHDIRVISGIPRPKYEIEIPKKDLDTLKLLNKGKSINKLEDTTKPAQ